ncbi:hypothetical protein O181_062716 [Austropuccinia psidii MF-1]|uniref:Uncharacterized protein n=1 Tax=Austropuccinia psidii MF-1 TaxID=1389203 RepID=A0A9Q3HYP4_9BASI|nr:hypothetical protein [Austropuccinia psidii MF-1]
MLNHASQRHSSFARYKSSYRLTTATASFFGFPLVTPSDSAEGGSQLLRVSWLLRRKPPNSMNERVSLAQLYKKGLLTPTSPESFFELLYKKMHFLAVFTFALVVLLAALQSPATAASLSRPSEVQALKEVSVARRWFWKHKGKHHHDGDDGNQQDGNGDRYHDGGEKHHDNGERAHFS